jgi:hypothetical protein
MKKNLFIIDSLRAIASSNCLTPLFLIIENCKRRLDLVSIVFFTTTMKRTKYKIFRMNYKKKLDYYNKLTDMNIFIPSMLILT